LFTTVLTITNISKRNYVSKSVRCLRTCI
jgi:hypothetical protein